MNASFQELTKLPFIKQLQKEFIQLEPTNKQLEDAFNKAMEQQPIGLRDKIMNFFASLIRLIYSSYKSKIEINTERQDCNNKFTELISKITENIEKNPLLLSF